MKKLLLILLISLSLSSYGEWTKTSEGEDGDSYYIDFQTIKELDNGNVVFWVMVDTVEGIEGAFDNEEYMSSKMYWEGDCNLIRFKPLSITQYKEPMGHGESESYDSYLEMAELDTWQYLPPDSLGYFNLTEVCLLADQSSMSNYEDILLETIAEFESFDWEEEDNLIYEDVSSELNDQLQVDITKNLTAEERIKLDELEAERAKQLLAYETEQYKRSLVQEIQEEQDLEREMRINEQRTILEKAWVNNIAARVKSVWRFPGSGDEWMAEVYVVQDRDGKVLAVDVQNTNVADFQKDKAFRNSVERAIYKASPLPKAPDESVFDQEITFTFRAN